MSTTWGRLDARIVVVQDCLRKWDVLNRRPLAGPGGGRLDEWLADVGLSRNDLVIETLCGERVTRDTLRAAKTKHELEYYCEGLHRRLARLSDPYVLVPLDDVGLWALTGKRGINKWRGSILAYHAPNGRTIKVIPSIHPQETFAAPALERVCRYDWARIALDSQFKELRLPERELWIRPTLRDVEQLAADLHRAPAVSIDIETPRELTLVAATNKRGRQTLKKKYGPSRITCVAFAPAANWAMCVPTTLDYWGNKDDLARVWSLVERICTSPVEKVLQNGLFDRFHLWRERAVRVVNHRWDTLCLSHAWDSASKHSLAFMASIWTREPYWKDDAKDADDLDGDCDAKSIEDFWRYNARDAAVTYEIKERLVPVLQEDRLLDLYLLHYPPLFDPLLQMMLDGVLTDPSGVRAHLLELDTQLATTLAELNHETMHNITYRDGRPYGQSIVAKKSISNAKLQEVLYEVLRLPKRSRLRKDTGERTATADAVALRALALKHGEKCGRLVELILRYRRTGKIKDFIKEGVSDADRRVRCQYKFTTETHRLASSKNPARTGQNLQNVDRSVRRHYVPDPGTVFVELDASQAEDRIVKVLAYQLTGNRDLLWRAQAMPWENDEHKRAASAIFGVPTEQVTKAQRVLGKTSRHASNYGMQGKTHSENLLKQGIVITPDEAQRMIDAILAADPEVAEWQRWTRMEVMERRRITNAWGWSLNFRYDRLGDDVWRRAYAYRPQSDCGIMTNLNGIVPFWHWLDDQRRRERTAAWRATRLALQVHDAIIVCAPPETAYDVAVFLKQHLETPIPYTYNNQFTLLSIPAELKVGRSWQMDHEWKRFPERDEFRTICERLVVERQVLGDEVAA